MGKGELTLNYESLLEEMAQAIAVHSDGVCLFANSAFLELFRLNHIEHVQGHFMGEWIVPWPDKQPRLGFKTAMGRPRNADPLEIELITLPLLCSNSNGVYQTMVRDVTALRSWEDKMLQAERLTAMGKLAGEIAHEINNPLGGILLYANLIKERLEPESAIFQDVEKIAKLATRCRIIAKGLLNFGKPMSRAFAPVDMNLVVRQMFSMVEDHKLFRNIQVDMKLQSDLPHIMGDVSQMEQVVLNLIVNAGEAMNGKGRLKIETRLLKEQNQILLSLEDSGPGVPPELLSRIFEPFFTTKRHGKGTGLGLSITHGIVQRHGGRIVVRSEPGQGACFDVLLPAP
jgi:two-component system NtrC family sensor kinase